MCLSFPLILLNRQVQRNPPNKGNETPKDTSANLNQSNKSGQASKKARPSKKSQSRVQAYKPKPQPALVIQPVKYKDTKAGPAQNTHKAINLYAPTLGKLSFHYMTMHLTHP